LAKASAQPSKSKRPLKIGIDARLAYRRGVGTYAANLILALSKVDLRNHYFIFNASAELKRRIAHPRFHWLEIPFSNAAYYEQVLLPRAALEQGVDFLHYVDNSATAISEIPFVLTLHDAMYTRALSEVRPHPSFRQRLVHAYKRWAIIRSAPRAQAVITVSEFSKGQILRQKLTAPGKIVVTPEGVDLKGFKRVTRKPSKIFKILVHGAADERKNLANILKAAKRLVEKKKIFQLVVIGMDAAELKCTNYVEQVTALGLGRQVEWAGNVPTEMLNQVYAEADLFLYPSRLEGFGLPVLEAFACGVPVVASQTSSLPEVAGKAALLVDPENPEAIAKAAGLVMEKPALRQALIRRGLRRAKLFTWEKTARLTLKVYEGMRR